ncbi:hypothetical protein [Chitinivorax sp. B]|uniref:hypothetical protein n=1 Tax=Chitinivorax sp. B TaxID=2502235 RepID=UPI001484D8BA|nr:hypothetical protein [Chitinivorax sp. B]
MNSKIQKLKMSLLLSLALPTAVVAAGANGDARIQKMVGPHMLTIVTTDRVAGAIDSMTWGGVEFVNSSDHGRQIQSSASFLPCGEAYNPTEAGSEVDGVGNYSSSNLLAISAVDNVLRTSTQMAYWRRVTSVLNCPSNLPALSNFKMHKAVTVGSGPFPHAIKYETTFEIPGGLPSAIKASDWSTLEVVTGYLPSTGFSADDAFLYTPNTDHRLRTPIAWRPWPEANSRYQEFQTPVIMPNRSGTAALGMYFLPSTNGPYLKYRVTDFSASGVVTWTLRVDEPRPFAHVAQDQPTPAYTRSYRVYVIVGSIENVQTTMDQMASNPGAL